MRELRVRVRVWRQRLAPLAASIRKPPVNVGIVVLVVHLSSPRKRSRADESVDFTVPSEQPITAAVSAIERSAK
jgi:hypothetical protein